jgi:CubicO group peptidase (beta-lactamase class C family)
MGVGWFSGVSSAAFGSCVLRSRAVRRSGHASWPARGQGSPRVSPSRSLSSTPNGSALRSPARGLAHRGFEIPNEVDTRFAIASGTKGLTALVVVSLIEDGLLELSTTARSVLGQDLPLIDEGVTIEYLLSHRSGIGDYLDEEAEPELSEYLMPVSVHELATTEDFLAVLDGHPTKFAPGKRFAYSNGGYVVLALLAERPNAMPFHDLVRQRVCEPAGMPDTEFLRSDELPGRTAVGYLAIDGVWRTNVFHLPVRGNGRRDLLDRGRRQRALEGALRRSNRVHGLGRRDDPRAQRRAV